jgi:hypothetical protein
MGRVHLIRVGCGTNMEALSGLRASVVDCKTRFVHDAVIVLLF